ncbi:MAG: alkaline phosphatase [Treponema sp.]|jgi:alkaline phosphatase|nr:alkaline phosphatase [Treponema sp.]
MKKRILFVFIALAFVFQSLFAGGLREKSANDTGIVTGKGQAKYVFLFVADGMAASQFSAAEYYLASKDSITNYGITRLNFTQFPAAGISNTHDYGSLITDSASAGTAFASGKKTLSSMINVDPKDGKSPYKTIAEYAREAGMKIGIVSTVTLTHATPASFYGKTNNRNNTDGTPEVVGLAKQLVESGFDYYGGGWIVGNSANNDKYVEDAKQSGYTVTRTPAAFNGLTKTSGKVIALAERVQDSGAMHYEIDRKPTDLSIVDFTKKGIELLENPKGFFFMVESGKIDWAGHANDAGALIHDMLIFDKAIEEALAFQKRYPKETLIVVIGDHETGGMGVGWAGTAGIPAQPGVSANLGMGYSMYFEKISRQTRSYVAFDDEVINPYKARVGNVSQRKIEDLYADILQSFGIDLRPGSLNVSEFQKNQIEIAFKRSMEQPVTEPQEGWRVFHSSYEPLSVKLTQILNQTAGIGWTSYSHTATPVATFATGVHQEIFSGYYDNTQIFFKLASAMNIKVD